MSSSYPVLSPAVQQFPCRCWVSHPSRSLGVEWGGRRGPSPHLQFESREHLALSMPLKGFAWGAYGVRNHTKAMLETWEGVSVYQAACWCNPGKPEVEQPVINRYPNAELTWSGQVYCDSRDPRQAHMKPLGRHLGSVWLPWSWHLACEGRQWLYKKGSYCCPLQVCLAAALDRAAGGWKLCEEIQESEKHHCPKPCSHPKGC